LPGNQEETDLVSVIAFRRFRRLENGSGVGQLKSPMGRYLGRSAMRVLKAR
jgi:hypothetical protein